MPQSPFIQSSSRYVIDKCTEDESIIIGYLPNPPKYIISHLLSVLLLGLPYLVAKWKPRWRLAATCSTCQLWQADTLLIIHRESQDVYIVVVKSESVGPDFPEKYSVCSSTSLSRDTSSLLDENLREFRYFLHKHIRYGWNSETSCFERILGLDQGTAIHTILTEYSGGVPTGKFPSLLHLHGKNSIEVSIPSYISLLVEEVLHPFYIFQLCSITLWSLDNYFYYAGCILIISLISVAVSLYETRRQAESLHDMVAAGSDRTCTVLRNGAALPDIDCSALVPGDALVLPRGGCTMNCDAVLLTGAAIVNEAMLTGESVPVTKSALPRLEDGSDETFNPETHKRHTIFAGTQVIQTRFYGDQEVVAVVVRTGFHTSKGELIRSILFPRPMDFQFYRDSVRFIMVLFSIATVGMVYCVLLFISRGADLSMILLRALDIITIVVPPALPAAMTVGTVYAQGRLRKQGIFCISPARINVCGKLKLICFDKTGTLTEDGLDLKGVLPATSASFDPPVQDFKELDEMSPLLWGLASCHSLTTINGSLTGDPLDAKMFEGTGWDLEEQGEDEQKFDKMMPTVVKPRRSSAFSMHPLPLELGIIRQFTFSSTLARMSVITRELGSSNFTVFTKGAPEKLEDICDPRTIPHDFHDRLKHLTLQGYRVIALAYKPLEETVNWIKIQKIKREAVEADLTFLGFLVMQNTLKPETEGVIRELKMAELKIVMITGDNLLTAVSVGRDCGIVERGDRVIVLEVVQKEEKLFIQFQDAEGSRQDPVDSKDELDLSFSPDLLNESYQNSESTDTVLSMDGARVHLAVTGKIWSIIIKHFPHLVPRVLVQGTVFARMSPDQKAQLVEQLQTLGYVVSMCGDGANDCGALKAAHVGVSLSEAEASVAAPFTSKIPNISCIPRIILEGRCALVTSFGVFKYMALYSMIQFISVLILYTNKTNLGDTQFLYIDLVITTTVAVLMGRTEPWHVLVKQRPPGSLVAGQTLMSILTQILASLAGQLAALFYLQSKVWYTPVEPSGPDDEVIVDAATTTIFIVSSYQYLVLATLYSTGPPYRKPFYTNVLYLGALLALSGFTAWLLFLPSVPFPALQTFFELQTLYTDYKVGIMCIVVVNLLVNLLLETVVNSGTWVKSLYHILKRKRGPKNKYKLVMRDIASEPGWPEDGLIMASETYSQESS